jgi:hypothetical protein
MIILRLGRPGMDNYDGTVFNGKYGDSAVGLADLLGEFSSILFGIDSILESRTMVKVWIEP